MSAGGHTGIEYESFVRHTRRRIGHFTAFDSPMDNRRHILLHSSWTEIQEHSDRFAVQFFDAIAAGDAATAAAHIETFPGICGHHAIGSIEDRPVEFSIRHR